MRGTLKFLKVIDIMSAGWENKDSSVKISVCHKWKFIEALREDGKASLYTSKLAFSSPNSGLGAVSIKAFCPKMPLHHRLLLTWTLKIRCFNHEVLPWNSCTNQNCYFLKGSLLMPKPNQPNQRRQRVLANQRQRRVGLDFSILGKKNWPHSTAWWN